METNGAGRAGESTAGKSRSRGKLVVLLGVTLLWTACGAAVEGTKAFQPLKLEGKLVRQGCENTLALRLTQVQGLVVVLTGVSIPWPPYYNAIDFSATPVGDACPAAPEGPRIPMSQRLGGVFVLFRGWHIQGTYDLNQSFPDLPSVLRQCDVTLAWRYWPSRRTGLASSQELGELAGSVTIPRYSVRESHCAASPAVR